MKVLPCTNGYVVTNGISLARTFHEWEYESRETCRASAIAFAFQMELYYPHIRVLFRRMVQSYKLTKMDELNL